MTTGALIVDAYQGDGVGGNDWTRLALAGRPWCGAILKASEGISYAPSWFVDNWRAVKLGGGPRFGHDWFRGAYHYLRVKESGVAQAVTFLQQVQRGGGWDVGDLWPIVDIEHTGNEGASKQQVIDGANHYTLKILAETGRRPMLYGGSLLRDLGIRDRMGCQLLWTARYSSTLPASTYESIGWDRAHLWAWQYCGDGQGSLANYPTATPIGSKLDISVITIDDEQGPEAPLAFTRTHLGSNPR